MYKKKFFYLKHYFDAQVSHIRKEDGPVTGVRLQISIQHVRTNLQVENRNAKIQDVDVYILDLLNACCLGDYHLEEDKSRVIDGKIELVVTSATGFEYKFSQRVNLQDEPDEDWDEFLAKTLPKGRKLRLTESMNIFLDNME